MSNERAIRNVQSAVDFMAESGRHDTMEMSFDDLNGVLGEIDRLRTVENAARRFIAEADSHPRYLAVRTWATPEADPYLNLRSALVSEAQKLSDVPAE
jgi:hypothetical protein